MWGGPNFWNVRRAGSGLPAAVLALCAFFTLGGCASLSGETEREATFTRQGQGKPVVVMQAGFGDDKSIWAGLMPQLAGEYTAFAFDRPGSGGHPASAIPPGTPRDPCTLAAEQRRLLQQQGLPPPYLLLGHSLGGLYQYAYARLYPQEVAGLVLLDPTHPRNWETLQREMPAAAVAIQGMKTLALSAVRAREFDDQTRCLERFQTAAPLSIPTVLLISGRPDEMASEGFEQARQALAEDWRQSFAHVRLQRVWESGHYIHREQPRAVLNALHRLSGRSETPEPDLAHRPARLLGYPDLDLQPGATRLNEVEARWGQALLARRDGANEVRIYSDAGPAIPAVVSLLPIVGDIVDALHAVRSWQGRHEWILHFDPEGKLLRANERVY